MAIVDHALDADLRELQPSSDVFILLACFPILVEEPLQVKVAQTVLVRLPFVTNKVNILLILHVKAFPVDLGNDGDEVPVELVLIVLAHLEAVGLGEYQEIVSVEHC